MLSILRLHKRLVNITGYTSHIGSQICAEHFSSDRPLTTKNHQRDEKYIEFRRTQKISRAMEAYINQTRETNEMIQKEKSEFELGKRHLANMMGLDPDLMIQDDIDEAIAYLLPSGLFSPRSRPTMKPPTHYFPDVKPAQFNEEGRPFDTFFYTVYPKFYAHLYGVFETIERLDKILEQSSPAKKDAKLEMQVEPKQIILTGTKWFDAGKLSEVFIEKITSGQAKKFESAMDYLISHPCAYLEEDFIRKFRTDIVSAAATMVEYATEIKTDEAGRSYAEAEARRKNCYSFVKVYANGTGKFLIDGNDLMQFEYPDSKEQLMHPFLILDRWEQFDVVARTENGKGENGRAGAVRLGLCKALCPFLAAEEIEKLKISGLLTRDPRRKERNKFQHIGARRRPTWKRR